MTLLIIYNCFVRVLRGIHIEKNKEAKIIYEKLKNIKTKYNVNVDDEFKQNNDIKFADGDLVFFGNIFNIIHNMSFLCFDGILYHTDTVGNIPYKFPTFDFPNYVNFTDSRYTFLEIDTSRVVDAKYISINEFAQIPSVIVTFDNGAQIILRNMYCLATVYDKIYWCRKNDPALYKKILLTAGSKFWYTKNSTAMHMIYGHISYDHIDIEIHGNRPEKRFYDIIFETIYATFDNLKHRHNIIIPQNIVNIIIDYMHGVDEEKWKEFTSQNEMTYFNRRMKNENNDKISLQSKDIDLKQISTTIGSINAQKSICVGKFIMVNKLDYCYKRKFSMNLISTINRQIIEFDEKIKYPNMSATNISEDQMIPLSDDPAIMLIDDRKYITNHDNSILINLMGLQVSPFIFPSTETIRLMRYMRVTMLYVKVDFSRMSPFPYKYNFDEFGIQNIDIIFTIGNITIYDRSIGKNLSYEKYQGPWLFRRKNDGGFTQYTLCPA